MYCVTDMRFYCNGGAKQSAAKFNAMFSDLKTMLKRHPDVTCTAFDEEDWLLRSDDLAEDESDSELKAQI